MAVSSIENSEVYHTVIPVFLMSLGSLYIIALLFRYMSWRFRRRRAKQARQYHLRVERFWKKQIQKMETAGPNSIQLPTRTYSKEKKHMPPSFDSSATLVVSAKSVHHNNEQDNYSLQGQQIRIFKEKSKTFYLPQKHDRDIERQQTEGNNTSFSLLAHWIASLITRDRTPIRQEKHRRQILWRWSVAMGYCKYQHGHKLDTIIDDYLENQNGSSSSNGSSSNSSSSSSSGD